MTKLELSTWSIVKTILILIGFAVLWQIHDILTLVFIVLIAVAALRPAVEWFVRRGISRGAAVSFLMLIAVGSVILVLSLVMPSVIDQLQIFILVSVPNLMQRLSPYYESLTQGKQILRDLLTPLQHLSSNALSAVVSFFGGVVSVVTAVVMIFYLLLDPHPLRQIGVDLLPIQYRNQVLQTMERIGEKMGAWLRSQFLLSAIFGIITALGMWLIGVPLPLAIGLLAGILQIVPIVGAILAGIIMILLAATAPDPVLLRVISTLIFAIALHVVGTQFFVPNIMRQAIGLSPAMVILALLIGAKLGGVMGVIIALPLAAILQVAAQDLPKYKKLRRPSAETP